MFGFCVLWGFFLGGGKGSGLEFIIFRKVFKLSLLDFFIWNRLALSGALL